MNISRGEIEVGGIPVEVVRKKIKNLHISVYPPDGRVKVSAPERFGEESVRLAVASKLTWIRRKQKAFAEQPRQSPREMVSGESHYFLGRRHLLRVVEEDAPNRVEIKGNREMTLRVRPGMGREKREKVLDEWYRRHMKGVVPELIRKWEPAIGVEVVEWGVKKMKTRWGSCNVRDRRVWLNLELAKKAPRLLEYVVVHEMVHILERRHDERFRSFMDEFMPGWRGLRDELNGTHLSHGEWDEDFAPPRGRAAMARNNGSRREENSRGSSSK
ncbi:MAG: M48 family metallopeptidase [Rubrobacteraceae bacterium]